MSDLAEIREKHGAFMGKFGCDVKVAWPTVYALLDALPSLAEEIERLRNEIAGNNSLIGRMAAAIQMLLRAQIRSGNKIERLRAALREMLQVNAACARTIVLVAATDDLKDELRAAGIANGFGERARAALGEATDE